MREKCGSYTARVSLLIFNFLLFCIGCTLIGVGAWIVANDDGLLKELDFFKNAPGGNFLRVSAILLLSVGCFAVVVAIFGCFVTFNESPYFFAVYVVCLCICCAGMITGGVVAIAYKDKVIERLGFTLKTNLDSVQESYYQNVSSTVCTVFNGALWDYVQFKYKCCGIGDDYNNGYNPFTTENTQCLGNRTFPYSCCGNFAQHGVQFSPNSYSGQICMRNTKGCGSSIVAAVYRFAPILTGIGLGFGMFMLFGIVFAVCLCQNPTKNL